MTELRSHLQVQSIFREMSKEGAFNRTTPEASDCLRPVGEFLHDRIKDLITSEVIVDEAMDAIVQGSE